MLRLLKETNDSRLLNKGRIQIDKYLAIYSELMTNL